MFQLVLHIFILLGDILLLVQGDKLSCFHPGNKFINFNGEQIFTIHRDNSICGDESVEVRMQHNSIMQSITSKPKLMFIYGTASRFSYYTDILPRQVAHYVLYYRKRTCGYHRKQLSPRRQTLLSPNFQSSVQGLCFTLIDAANTQSSSILHYTDFTILKLLPGIFLTLKFV